VESVLLVAAQAELEVLQAKCSKQQRDCEQLRER
jgi:hypothetical protein